MKYLPIFLDLNNKPCLVVGAGQVATRKIKHLLTAGASVTVISLEICDEIKDLSLLEALQRIITLAIHKLRNINELSEILVQNMLDALMGSVVELFNLKMPLTQVTCLK